jgi:hypothetical protein
MQKWNAVYDNVECKTEILAGLMVNSWNSPPLCAAGFAA